MSGANSQLVGMSLADYVPLAAHARRVAEKQAPGVFVASGRVMTRRAYFSKLCICQKSHTGVPTS